MEASLCYELHFLSSSDSVVVKDVDQSCYRLHEQKVPTEGRDEVLFESKKNLQLNKGFLWKVNGKLKDQIKDLEDLISNYKCVTKTWLKIGLLCMFFQNGTICFLHFSPHGRLERICMDKYLHDKLASDNPLSCTITSKNISIAFYEPKISIISLQRSFTQSLPASSSFGQSTYLKSISQLDARLCSFDTVGVQGRKPDRKVLYNNEKRWLLTYWGTAKNEALPWTPLMTDKNRANLIVYTLLESDAIELFSYGRIDRKIHDICFSTHISNNILSLEEHEDEQGNIIADICIYQIAPGRFVRLSCVSIIIEGTITASSFNQSYQKLLISTSSNNIYLYDSIRRNSFTKCINMPISKICWHPDGAFALLSSQQTGKIICVDLALNSLPLQSLSDKSHRHEILDLNPFFRHKPTACAISWQPNNLLDKTAVASILIERTCILLIRFTFGCSNLEGPLIGPLQLLVEYLRHDQVEAALSVLDVISWCEQPIICYRCILSLANYLLRQPFTDQVELQLEKAMGSFFCETDAMEQDILDQYFPKVANIARRFFFLLLRHKKFEKAFLLAVDINCVDLFYDLCTIAKRYNLNGLLVAAQKKIDTIEYESNSCTSYDSETGSESSTESSEEEEEVDWKQHKFIQLQPTMVKVASATPTRHITTSLPRNTNTLMIDLPPSCTAVVPYNRPSPQSPRSNAAITHQSNAAITHQSTDNPSSSSSSHLRSHSRSSMSSLRASKLNINDLDDVNPEHTELAKGVECIYFGPV